MHRILLQDLLLKLMPLKWLPAPSYSLQARQDGAPQRWALWPARKSPARADAQWMIWWVPFGKPRVGRAGRMLCWTGTAGSLRLDPSPARQMRPPVLRRSSGSCRRSPARNSRTYAATMGENQWARWSSGLRATGRSTSDPPRTCHSRTGKPSA